MKNRPPRLVICSAEFIASEEVLSLSTDSVANYSYFSSDLHQNTVICRCGEFCWIRKLVQQVVGWEEKPSRSSLVFLESASAWQKKCRCLPDRNTKVTNDKSSRNICLQQKWQSRGLREKAIWIMFSVPWLCFNLAGEMQMSVRQKSES